MCIRAFPLGKVVIFVTNNVNKFKEASRILDKYGISIAMLKIKAIEIQDDNLENIAAQSAIDAVARCNLPILVEDAGLFIEALNGFPGPYSSYVYRTLGPEGILKLLEGEKRRDAFFRSVIAFHSPERDKPKCFHGEVKGKISKKKRGTSGFGFDPIFIPLGGRGKTFAEMTIDEKNRFSHRAQALRKFAEWYRSMTKI